MKNAIIVIISTTLILYLSGCLSESTFNITKWSEGTRMSVAIIWACIELLAVVIVFSGHTKQYNE